MPPQQLPRQFTRQSEYNIHMPPSSLCPTNHQPGQRVDTVTLKALLARPLTALTAAEYRFCRAPDCPTVYYSADGAQCFTEADLRERVFHKHLAETDAPVCYCFGYTVGDVATQPRATIELIQAGIRAGQCACDIRNPQGECCLGNVRALARQSSLE